MENVRIALKKYFDGQNYTQAEVGNMLGISQTYVGRIMKGKDSPKTPSSARKWADAFGFSYSFLLTGEGSLFDNDESLIMEEAKEYLDAVGSGDEQSIDYWKKKYDETVLELQQERGKVEGLRLALEALRSSAALPSADMPIKKSV